jgi:hypothetical protein
MTPTRACRATLLTSVAAYRLLLASPGWSEQTRGKNQAEISRGEEKMEGGRHGGSSGAVVEVAAAAPVSADLAAGLGVGDEAGCGAGGRRHCRGGGGALQIR